jgi:hypothetical protein
MNTEAGQLRTEAAAAEDAGGWRSAFSIFQDTGFDEIYAKHYGIDVLDLNGLLVIAKQVPLIGCLGGLLGGPEEYGPFEAWWEKVRELGCSYLCVKTSVKAGNLSEYLVSPEDNHNFVVDLRKGDEHVFKGFHRTQQQNIRRAQEKSIEIRMVEEEEGLKDLYTILVRISRNGTLFDVPPFALLKDLVRSPYGKGLVAVSGNVVVGGLFLLLAAHVLHAWHGGPDPEMRHLNVGALLHYGAMQWGMAHGFPFYDMGDQSLSANKNLTRFKMHFSPQLIPAFQYLIPQSRIKCKVVDAIGSFFLKGERGPAAIPGCRCPEPFGADR